MIPLIIESTSQNQINRYLADKYYLANLVSEVIPENGTIGLPAIKFLIDRAKFAPGRQSVLVFLIRDGHLITPAGQNALLKTLEESKPEEQFIITTVNHYLLLPTICSRCQLVRLDQPQETAADPNQLSDLIASLTGPSAALLDYSDQIASNPAEKLDLIIAALCAAYRRLPTAKRIKIINLALTARYDLERNINPKLALDHFLLSAAKIIH